MSFAGDHEAIETLSPNRADRPLSVGILPWRSRRGWVVAYAHSVEALEERPSVGRVAIPNECFFALSVRLLTG